MAESNLESLKRMLRETEYPFFDDATLQAYLTQNQDNLNNTAYQCLLIKAEESELKLSGLTTGDLSKYFRRLASQYRPHNSGVLKGGF